MVSDDPESFADLDGHCPQCIDEFLDSSAGQWLIDNTIGLLAGAATGYAASKVPVDSGSPAMTEPGGYVLGEYLARKGGMEVAPIANENVKSTGTQAAQPSQGDQSTPANPNGQFEPSPKHGSEQKGNISAGPKDGQTALDNSVQVKDTSPRRVGVDKKNGQIVVLDQTSKDTFHGHVRDWKNLSSQQQNALIKAKLVDKKGKIL